MTNSLQKSCSLFQIPRFVCNLTKVNVQVKLFKGKLRRICRHHLGISPPFQYKTSQDKAGGQTENLSVEAGAVDEMQVKINLSTFNKQGYALIDVEECVNTQYTYYRQIGLIIIL